ncbi:hypothetical protein TgHK011_003107 [Trichoderma gracile]|nr:hypothetical protein TgHK011_003107 [Trichoderma gracile]
MQPAIRCLLQRCDALRCSAMLCDGRSLMCVMPCDDGLATMLILLLLELFLSRFRPVDVLSRFKVQAQAQARAGTLLQRLWLGAFNDMAERSM